MAMYSTPHQMTAASRRRKGEGELLAGTKLAFTKAGAYITIAARCVKCAKQRGMAATPPGTSLSRDHGIPIMLYQDDLMYQAVAAAACVSLSHQPGRCTPAGAPHEQFAPLC
jgi:hypothetical protein